MSNCSVKILNQGTVDINKPFACGLYQRYNIDTNRAYNLLWGDIIWAPDSSSYTKTIVSESLLFISINKLNSNESIVINLINVPNNVYFAVDDPINSGGIIPESIETNNIIKLTLS